MPGNGHLFEDSFQPALELRVSPRFRARGVAYSYASARQQDSPSFVEYPLPIRCTAQDLHQQYQVEDVITERQLSPISLNQNAILRVRGKLPQHGERCIDADIEVSHSNKSFSDTPRPRTNLKYPHGTREA